MQRRATDLKGYAIGARDGEIGSIEDLLFDDADWTVRYLVADTGTWLPGRKVLVSPAALGSVNPDAKNVSVSLTREQVRNCPDFDKGNFSRERQTAYHDYFGWPYYWIGEAVWAPGVLPGRAPEERTNEQTRQQNAPGAEQTPGNEPHIHSVNEIVGHYVEAKDGAIGHVEDFILDDESWEIRYLIVDTRNWLPGRKVLVAPEWIEMVNWIDSKLHIDLSRDAIESGPEYSSDAFNRDYEQRLHRHYNRRGYWSA